MGEMHGVFVAINLHRFLIAVILIGVIGIAARIGGPHVPFRLPFGDPFGQNLARTTALGDAEGEDAGLIGIGHTRHGTDQGQAVGGVRNGAVDHAVHADGAEDRDASHGVFDIPFEAFQIVWIELEAEILGHGIIGRHPMALAVALIGSEVQAVLVLTQVIGAVDVAQERHFAALFLGPCDQFGDFFGQEILVAHRRHGHGAAAIGFEPFADTLGVIACGIDHLFAADIALGRVDDPFAVFTADTCGGAEAFDAGPHVAGPFGERLGQLSRVDIAIVGIPESPGQVVRFDEGVAVLDVADRHHFQLHPLIAAHGAGAFKLHHPFLGMTKADGAGDVVIHRVIDLIRQTRVKSQRIALHVHHRPGGREAGAVARRVPCGACGEFVFLQKHAVGPSGLGQVIEAGGAHDAAADDDHAGCCWEIGHGDVLPIAPGRAGRR